VTIVIHETGSANIVGLPYHPVVAMKIVQFDQPGPPSVLEYRDAPVPIPEEGELLVRAHSIGVGVPEVAMRRGVYPWMPPLPCVPGVELSGTVEQVGSGVDERRVGQRVIISARDHDQRGGCYAEYVAVHAESTYPMPDGVSLELGATLANYQVAYHMLRDGARATAGDKLLVYGAAGGMGSALVDLGRAWGLTTIGVASGEDRCAFVRELGADHVIDRQRSDVADEVHAFTDGEGVNLILDPVAGDTVGKNVGMLARMGMLMIYGGLRGPETEDLSAVLRSHAILSPAIRRFTIHTLDGKPRERRAGMDALVGMLAEGTLHPKISTRLRLSDAVEAHEMLEAGSVLGNLILQPN